MGDVATSDATSALAFQVAFDNTVFWSDIERWRLDSFRTLRAYLLESGLQRPLPYELFDLATMASLKERRAGQSWRTFFATLDPHWERPELWERLAKLIAVPAEFTDVIYVYRNITNGLPIEYREVLLEDLRTRFGRLSLQQYLEPGLLRDIFGWWREPITCMESSNTRCAGAH